MTLYLSTPFNYATPLDLVPAVAYNIDVNRIVETEVFSRWFGRLRDQRAVDRITVRLIAARRGHFDDSRSVGDGVFEMRIHCGPGYRLYFIREGDTVIVLLCGGKKGSQRRDIERAKRMAKEWEGEDGKGV